jgi:hypothetical protein
MRGSRKGSGRARRQGAADKKRQRQVNQDWLRRAVPTLAAFFDRIDAEPVNFRRAKKEVRGEGGYRREILNINWSLGGTLEVTAPRGRDVHPDDLPTEAESKAIAAELANPELAFPHSFPVKSLDDAPASLRETKPEDLYIFRDSGGDITFVQQLVLDDNNDKHYYPWSYWSDRKWRQMEPDLLPLWGLDQLKNNSFIFLHEGAKAARYVRWMVEARTPDAREALDKHPWGKDLLHAAHLGWPGGALHPERVDWSTLPRDGNFMLVADNDRVGKEAVAIIARDHLPGRRLEAIFFDDTFPEAFDLADAFPEKMFETINGQRFYRGPSLGDCRIPATWATKKITTEKNRTSFVILPEFLDQWYQVDTPRMFAPRRNPSRLYTLDAFNLLVRPFSHSENTAKYLAMHPTGRARTLAYDPGKSVGGIIKVDGEDRLNTFVSPAIQAKKGDVQPFLDFMKHLIPDAGDRDELMKWIATLVARLDVRLGYGVLLISVVQGVGKTTLMEKILLPLVGAKNVSVPSERQVVESDFNSWLDRKRLVLIHEIYAGQSKRAYNEVKSYITEKKIRINEKFQPPYEIDNWAAFMAASNSKRALHMAQDDRRWFVPGITTEKKTLTYWTEFNDWLRSGGLEAIFQHLIDYARDGNTIAPGATAPNSAAKTEMIEQSKSEGVRIAFDLAEHVVALGKADPPQKITLLDRAVQSYVADRRGIRPPSDNLESLETIRNEMVRAGLTLVDEEVKSSGVRYRALVNHDAATDKEWAAWRKEWSVKNTRPKPGKSKLPLPHQDKPSNVYDDEL